VTVLHGRGNLLLYSTYLGGRGNDGGRQIALSDNGEVYVAGWTGSHDFPVTAGAFDSTYNGGSEDVFVARLSADGHHLLHSTYVGGGLSDGAASIAVNAQGEAFVYGWSASAIFPTTPGAFDETYNAGEDAILFRMEADLSDLVYSTFLGGSGWDTGCYASLAIDATGNAYVTGETESADFPTTPHASDTTHNGGTDTFVTMLNPAGSALLKSTFLGGSLDDDGEGIAVDAAGDIYVTGRTKSIDFPTTPGAIDTTYEAGWDVFVTKIIADPACILDSDCDDVDPCTLDLCLEFECENPPAPNGTPCGDMLRICCEGICIRPCLTDADCNDENICTDDSCEGEPGFCSALCEHIYDPTNDPRCAPRTPIQIFDEGPFRTRSPY